MSVSSGRERTFSEASGLPYSRTAPEPIPSRSRPLPSRSRDVASPLPTVHLYSTGGGSGTGKGTIRRTVHMTRHHCGGHVLAGLDDDRCGLVTIVDPYALTDIGEVEALRADRRTYRLRASRLDRRTRWSIPGHPPAHDLTVLAAHDCTGIPDAWRLPPAPSAPRPVKEDW